MSKANEDIRQAAKSGGVRLWEVAEALCISDGSFSRKLRRELPPDEKAKIHAIIVQLIGEREANA